MAVFRGGSAKLTIRAVDFAGRAYMELGNTVSHFEEAGALFYVRTWRKHRVEVVQIREIPRLLIWKPNCPRNPRQIPELHYVAFEKPPDRAASELYRCFNGTCALSLFYNFSRNEECQAAGSVEHLGNRDMPKLKEKRRINVFGGTKCVLLCRSHRKRPWHNRFGIRLRSFLHLPFAKIAKPKLNFPDIPWIQLTFEPKCLTLLCEV